MAQSFINNEELRDFNPGRGTANVEVLGRSRDGAIDIGFSWEEGKVPPRHAHHHSHSHSEVNPPPPPHTPHLHLHPHLPTPTPRAPHLMHSESRT